MARVATHRLDFLHVCSLLALNADEIFKGYDKLAKQPRACVLCFGTVVNPREGRCCRISQLSALSSLDSMARQGANCSPSGPGNSSGFVHTHLSDAYFLSASSSPSPSIVPSNPSLNIRTRISVAHLKRPPDLIPSQPSPGSTANNRL